MASLIDADFVKARITTTLLPARLQALIEDVQADLEQRFGAAYADGVTIAETVVPRIRSVNLYLKRRVVTVATVTELITLGDTAATTVASTQYYSMGSHGMLVRTDGLLWGAAVTVTYTTTDDRPKWREAMVDLIRLRLARMAMAGESIGDEFTYTAPKNWEAEERRIIRRIELKTA